jgi:hypothetical protein
MKFYGFLFYVNIKHSLNSSNNNNNNRSSPRSRAPTAEGVYSNSHFLHAAASQMGNNVRVQTKGGVVVEGIFRTFSENFSVSFCTQDYLFIAHAHALFMSF